MFASMFFCLGIAFSHAEASESFLKRLFYVSPIKPDITKQELERRITGIMSYENTSGGRVVSKYSAFFEGCVLVTRLDRLSRGCPAIGFWQLDRRIDLGFLSTHPADVRMWTPEGKQRLSPATTALTYEFSGGARARLRKVDQQYRKIVDQEYARIPEGGDTRMRVLGRRFRQELEDKIYENAGKITYWCSGFDTQGPFQSGGDYRARVPSNSAQELVDLMYVYSARYCGRLY